MKAKYKKMDYAKRLEELKAFEEDARMRNLVIEKEKELGLRPRSRKPSWTKIMMVVIYAICIEVIIYAEVAMWAKYDLSALYALIGVPAAMMGVFWSYAAKSRAENTKGGITYDTAMQAQYDLDIPGTGSQYDPDDPGSGGQGNHGIG